MIRLAFYIWDSQEIDRRHCLRSQNASGPLVESNKATYVVTKAKTVSALRGPVQLADLQGALCVPTNNLTHDIVDRIYLLLLWQRSSILSDS